MFEATIFQDVTPCSLVCVSTFQKNRVPPSLEVFCDWTRERM